MTFEWRAMPFSWNTSGTDESGDVARRLPGRSDRREGPPQPLQSHVTLGFAFYLPTEPRRSHIGRGEPTPSRAATVGSHGAGQRQRGAASSAHCARQLARQRRRYAATAPALRARCACVQRCLELARCASPGAERPAVQRVAGREARLDLGGLSPTSQPAAAKPSRMRLRTRTLSSAQKHSAAPARARRLRPAPATRPRRGSARSRSRPRGSAQPPPRSARAALLERRPGSAPCAGGHARTRCPSRQHAISLPMTTSGLVTRSRILSGQLIESALAQERRRPGRPRARRSPRCPRRRLLLLLIGDAGIDVEREARQQRLHRLRRLHAHERLDRFPAVDRLSAPVGGALAPASRDPTSCRTDRKAP